MFEFHGWATIHESTMEVDTGKLELVIESIQKFIKDLSWDSGFLKLYSVNGMYYLSVSGYLNRKTSEIKELMILYQLIANEAPGSYGLLYMRDDEDIEGFDNEFKVFVLKLGEIQQQKDPFLSPFATKVEDAF